MFWGGVKSTESQVEEDWRRCVAQGKGIAERGLEEVDEDYFGTTAKPRRRCGSEEDYRGKLGMPEEVEEDQKMKRGKKIGMGSEEDYRAEEVEEDRKMERGRKIGMIEGGEGDHRQRRSVQGRSKNGKGEEDRNDWRRWTGSQAAGSGDRRWRSQQGSLENGKQKKPWQLGLRRH
ncbi:hypothetical protein ACLOJK_011507 [Asimina triloba]